MQIITGKYRARKLVAVEGDTTRPTLARVKESTFNLLQGKIENAVVLDGEQLLNPEGFKVKNECVNHKVLDLIGDMYTSGYRIQADIKAYRTGHFHNNEILKKLFADSSNFEIL